MQATNAIRFVGDSVSLSGQAVEQLPVEFHAVIGSVERQAAIWLMDQLEDRKVVQGRRENPIHPNARALKDINLTLDGWERYEEERRGHSSGSHGFIAMKFGDPDLDSFVRDVVKPVVLEKTSYRLVDMRDISTAGVIANNMRPQIKDEAFVIAERVHSLFASLDAEKRIVH